MSTLSIEDKKSYWASNVKLLRQRRSLSMDQLANSLGFTLSKIKAHEGGQTKNPVVEDLIMISDFFRMSIDSLLKIDLSKLSDRSLTELEKGNDVYTSGTHLRILATTVDKTNKEHIEYVPHAARAGYVAGYADPEFVASLPLFSLPHLPQNRKFRMFPIVGDSMLPIAEGSLIICSYLEDWKSIKDGTPCIVVTRNDGIVFKLVTNQILKDRTLRLESLNTLYKPYEIAVEEVLEIWQFVSYMTDYMPAAERDSAAIMQAIEGVKRDLSLLVRKSGAKGSAQD
jgi:transcriptional regulator with XRE-family HTH domain